MPYRAKKRRPATSTKGEELHRRAAPEHLDHLLAQTLNGLAQLLVVHGYSYGQFAKLAKASFVKAAKTVNSKGNAKANIAGIAARTGLTRSEVSKLLYRKRANWLKQKDMNRASRVASGWLKDHAFVDENQMPKPLKYSAEGGSFQRLVKKYSGDIPARAMLSEMIRLGMVQSSANGLVTLKAPQPGRAASATSAIRAIAPWIGLIAASYHPLTALNSDAQKLTIAFSSLSEVLAGTREMRARWRAFLSGLKQLGTAGDKKNCYELTISAALATAKPKRRKTLRN